MRANRLLLVCSLFSAIVVQMPGAAIAAGDALDEAVTKIFQTRCVMCHDDRKAAAGGGVDNLLKLDELASGYLDDDAPADSYLIELTLGEEPSMPKKRMKDINWNGAISTEEQDSLREWIMRGGPSAEYREGNRVAERALITEWKWSPGLQTISTS